MADHKLVGQMLKDMGFDLEEYQFDEIWRHVPSWSIDMAERLLESGWRKS